METIRIIVSESARGFLGLFMVGFGKLYVAVGELLLFGGFMEEQRNVKWIVIISFIMLFVTMMYGPTILFGPYYSYPLSRDIWFYVNRLDTLLFLATVTTGALFGARFGKKELVYKLTLYFFIISMGLLFLSLLRTLFIPTPRWTL